MKFPQHIERWRPLVQRHFPSHAVDKMLWVIQHESSGNPSARNKSSGASGLTQILPSVHGQRNWTDPETNIAYAAKLYKQSGWKPWGGEGNTYNGKPFGALGKNPFPGDSGSVQGRAMTSQAARSTLPVANGRITQVFGRTNEKLDSGGMNKGLDISVPTGTSVRAVVGGTVVNAGDAGDGWGTSVKVRDAQGNIHNYGHLSGANVRKGDTVKPGQVIAKSGNTGASTGPHLSYDVKGANGQYIDPSPFLGFNAAGDNRQGHPAIGRDISEMSQESSYMQGSTYWGERVEQINEQLEQYEQMRETLTKLPQNVITQGGIQQQLATIDANIQNLQAQRDEAQMFAQQEQQAGLDAASTQAGIAATYSQIDINRINAAVAEGRLTLDQAIHQLNSEITRRQTALAEETARRNQGLADAEYISSELNQAAAWAPQEPGKTDYTVGDLGGATAQVLGDRGIGEDQTVAQYSGTRVVDPQRTLAEAGGGASGGRGSAPGMGWTDDDRAQPEEPPAPPATGTGTTTGGSAPPASSASPATASSGVQSKPGASFAGNAAPPGHPASTSPTKSFAGNTPPRGHPAGPPTFSGNTPPTGHPAQTGLLGPQTSAGPGYTAPDYMSIIFGQNDYRGPGTYSDRNIGPGYDADDYNARVFGNRGLLGGTFKGNTPPPGHPAMRRR